MVEICQLLILLQVKQIWCDRHSYKRYLSRGKWNAWRIELSYQANEELVLLSALDCIVPMPLIQCLIS